MILKRLGFERKWSLSYGVPHSAGCHRSLPRQPCLHRIVTGDGHEIEQLLEDCETLCHVVCAVYKADIERRIPGKQLLVINRFERENVVMPLVVHQRDIFCSDMLVTGN